MRKAVYSGLDVTGKKKSGFVSLGLTSAIAVSMAGCNSRPALEAQRCVDQGNKVVEEQFCNEANGVAFYPHRWYYGGRGFFPGEYAVAGTYAPTPGMSSIRPSSPGFSSISVARGGFGATAAGESGGS